VMIQPKRRDPILIPDVTLAAGVGFYFSELVRELLKNATKSRTQKTGKLSSPGPGRILNVSVWFRFILGCVCVLVGMIFLGLIISFLVFLWDFVVEVGFGGRGACPFLMLWLMFLDLVSRTLMWFGFV
jgi:hypothetical protein